MYISCITFYKDSKRPRKKKAGQCPEEELRRIPWTPVSFPAKPYNIKIGFKRRY